MKADERRPFDIVAERRGQNRHRALSALLPSWQLVDLDDDSEAGQAKLCNLLAAALRRERQRGLVRDWTYSVARHAAIVRALPLELRRLAAIKHRRARLLAARAPADPG